MPPSAARSRSARKNWRGGCGFLRFARTGDRGDQPDHQHEDQNCNNGKNRIELAVAVLFALLRLTVGRTAIALLAPRSFAVLILIIGLFLPGHSARRLLSDRLCAPGGTAVALRLLFRLLFVFLRFLWLRRVLTVRRTLLPLGKVFFHVPFFVVIEIIRLAAAIILIVVSVVRRAIVWHNFPASFCLSSLYDDSIDR